VWLLDIIETTHLNIIQYTPCVFSFKTKGLIFKRKNAGHPCITDELVLQVMEASRERCLTEFAPSTLWRVLLKLLLLETLQVVVSRGVKARRQEKSDANYLASSKIN